MNIKEALSLAVRNLDLNREQMIAVMRDIMVGKCTPSQIGAFLTAMRMKSESIEEITGAAIVLREMATTVSLNANHLIDIVGTGGDEAHLFNVSTASAFVAAAAGAHVAKHGNRGVSSSSGSADLLEKSGVNLGITPLQVARCVEEVGVGFMFAPAHHAATKNVAIIRKELGFRTFFNILGPMSNPANVPSLVIGVFTRELCRPMAEVLKELGNKHVMIVHSQDGLDEISIASQTHVAELKDGKVIEYSVTPEDLGIESQSLVGLSVANSADSLDLIKSAFGRKDSANARKAADMIALNAGAALYVSGIAGTTKQGVEIAQDIIASGKALEKMQELAALTQAMSE